MSVPQIPPRPVRSHQQQQQQQQPPTLAPSDIPKVPPRPGQRRSSDRSQSPNRDHFPRSPFNEPPLGTSLRNRSGNVYGSNSQDASSSSLDLPQRPPSVSLPSIGQEGNEYADIDYCSDIPKSEQEADIGDPHETRNVAGDLPLHAPKPSFTNSMAKKRVSAVTRTDSTQAAAMGMGKPPTPADDRNPHERNLKSKVSFRTASSTSTERPGSSQTEDDHGIPEIGQRVPMYPDAGDVQAPSPSPHQQAFPAGIGFHNSGQKPHRHHRRTPSGREVLPPGSYGMHGHGVPASDQFEKSWYEKHPEALEKEEPAYGPGIGGGRGEWALSSEDLNRLVRETPKLGPDTPGLPKEEIGYMASEEYAARLNALSATGYRSMHSSSSQPHVESPLRKASFPDDGQTDYPFAKTQSHTSSRFSSENALESETEDEGPLSPPHKRKSRIHGNGYDGNAGDWESERAFLGERGYSVPILAPDEVAKTPFSEFQQPAVSPPSSRRGSAYYASPDTDASHPSGVKIGSRSGSAANSRPPSRPASVHSLPALSRLTTHDDDRENMHTPLEDVDEYEPLFPDEDGNKERRRVTAADRLKLREQIKRFPSKDIWEDTPNSLQLQATVETPEPANEQPDPMLKAPSAVFETPEQESARKGEVSEEDKASLIPREERLAKSHFKPHIRNEMHRPGMAHRFPSRDIWEDSPDSARLETIVGVIPSRDPRSPTDEGLEAGAVVNTTGAPNQGVLAGEQPRDNATAGATIAEPIIPPRSNKDKFPIESSDLNMETPPTVPARPPRRLYQVPPADAQVPIAPSKLSETSPPETKQPSLTEARKAPMLPERKPQIPTRPIKPAGHESSETAPLSKIASASSDGAGDRDKPSPPAAPKCKPAIPARPAGSKIASLKAGFMSDLDSRLKLGPQALKPQDKAEPEVTEDKAPLLDARKGRAKGPARRKPAVPAAAETDMVGVSEESKAATARDWSIQEPWTVWQHDGVLKVGHPEIPRLPTADAMTLDDISTATRAPPSTSQTDGAEDANAIQRAKRAVEESLAAKEPLSQDEMVAPETAEDLPGPAAEVSDLLTKETTKEPESLSSSPSTVILPLTTDTQSQTGVKDITVNPGTEHEEKMTVVIGGEAGGGDAIVRE